MPNLINLLQNLGLNEKEAKLYLACLELGQTNIKELSEKSGINRTNIYNFIATMKEKGLITEIERNNKTVLIAENPQLLAQRAEQTQKSLQEAFPELMAIFNLPGGKARVRFYEGIEGLKKIYDDTLASREPIYAFSDYEKMMPTMDADYMWHYANTRASKNIKIYCIAKKGKWANEVMKKNKEQMREMKIIKEDIDFDTEINIYGNKVAMLSFKKSYAGVIIEDKSIAQTLKSVWKLLWNHLK